MREIRDLKNDPDWRLARYIAEHVYVVLGCASVPALQRVIDDALRKNKDAVRGRAHEPTSAAAEERLNAPPFRRKVGRSNK